MSVQGGYDRFNRFFRFMPIQSLSESANKPNIMSHYLKGILGTHVSLDEVKIVTLTELGGWSPQRVRMNRAIYTSR